MMEQVERPIPRPVRACFLVLAVYGTAFVLLVPAMATPGWEALAADQLTLGPIAPVRAPGRIVAISPELIPCLACLANPLLWIGLCLVEAGRRAGAVAVSVLAVGFASLAIGLVRGHFCPAYVAWIASIFLLLATAASMPRDRRAVAKPPAIDPDL